jgi:dethiobiotin synthetase
MASRSLTLSGLVVGAWPQLPDLAERCNISDLEGLAGQPLSGALPAEAASLDDAAFAVAAERGLAPALGGEFDAAAFRQAAAP